MIDPMTNRDSSYPVVTRVGRELLFACCRLLLVGAQATNFEIAKNSRDSAWLSLL